jgi:TonB-dependent receptor-like protein
VEENWTTSQNFTKIMGTHQIRFGFDGILLKLTHWQPELGGGPRGVFYFDGDITSLKGGDSPTQFNDYAAFLLGDSSRMRKALQHIINSGREWQFAGYVTDRWQATSKLTVNFGIRYEYFPIMTRARGKGLERYDPETNLMYLGGYGNVPKNTGITSSKKQFSPRLGLAYRLDDRTVIRAGYGLNYDPMPFSRPMRGQYPYVPTFDLQRDNSFETFRTLDEGIPPLEGPDLSTGILEVPATAGFRSPWGGQLDRGYIQSWNFTMERNLPMDIIGSVAYVGTSSIGMLGDRDINASFIGEGNAGRPYAPGRTQAINMWDSYLNANYHSLQVAVNKSFSQGFMLKGAYTYSKAINMTDDDGWAGVGWDSAQTFSRNRARAGYDRTQMFQLGFVYELPLGKGKAHLTEGAVSHILGGWQISGIVAALTGTPRTVSASGSSLNAASNSQTADQTGAVNKIGNAGPGQFYYSPSSFAPVTDARFGTTGRNIIDGPGRARIDLSFFKNFQITERVRTQFRAEFFNFTNHPQFGNPNTNANSGGFMQITSASDERNIRLGLRFDF